jgi:uncharacterized protein with ParB-like and HNH nuclease domain
MKKNSRVNNLSTFLAKPINEILTYLSEKYPNEKFDANKKLKEFHVSELIFTFGTAEMKNKIQDEATSTVLSMLNNSKSNLLNLKSIFLNNILRIPDYQRGFSWTDKELKELFNDILELGETRFHFTGILTLEPVTERTKIKIEREEAIAGLVNSNNDIEFFEEFARPFFIVDGQQRLTSLIILLTALDKKLEQLENYSKSMDELEVKFLVQKHEKDDVRIAYRFGYEKDTPSYEFLIKEILGEKIENTQPETIYTKNLSNALTFFNKEFEKLSERTILEFKNKVLNCLLFNVVILDSNQLDISLVFETLNYRGKQLSKLEIFKNRLIFLLSRVYDDDNAKFNYYRDEIVKTWLHIYAWLAKSSSKNDDDKFLKDFWIVFFNHSDTIDRRTDDEEEKISFNSFEIDFFEKRFPITNPKNNKYINSDENIELLLFRLSQGVEAWHFVKYPELVKEPEKIFSASLNVKNRLFLLKWMLGKGDYYTPLAMALFMKSQNMSDIEEVDKIRQNFLDELIRYRFVLFHINGKSSDTGRARVYRKANEFLEKRNGTSARAVCHDLSTIIAQNHSIDQFIDYIHSRNQNSEQFDSWKGLYFSLWLYYNKSKNQFYEKSDILSDYGSFYYYQFFIVEESIQKKFKNLKRDNTYSMKILQNSIGNYFLTNKKNDRTEVDSRENWTYEDLLKRGVEIISFLENYFNIPLGKEEEKKRLLMGGVKPRND